MSETPPPAHAATGLLRARAIAAFIDASMALLPSAIVMLLVFGNLMHAGDWVTRFARVAGVGWIALILIGAGQCLLVGFTGQSYGKLAMKLRVVRVDGGKASLLAAGLIRTVICGALWIFLPGFALLDVGVGLIRGDGRCVHDLFAGTKVVAA